MALGPRPSALVGRLTAQDYQELVPAYAREQRVQDAAGLALGLEEAAQPLRDFLERGVAGLVAEGVVDALEPIQVHEQEDGGLVGLERADEGGAVDPDLLPVRKAGDGIVEGELADAPEARAQIEQHRLEGEAEAVHLAEPGRAERHVEITLGDRGR